jgi:hypothetical protein
MAENDPNPIFAYSALTNLASRLSDHAAEILARRDVATDLRLATNALHRFATFKFRIAHIATRVDSAVATAAIKSAPDWDNLIAALNDTGRELRDAVADAERDVGESA